MRQAPPLHDRSTVCALIPHYGCEQWLVQALESLLEQTRPPERIVVIDDGSPVPPIDVVAAYPDVTLVATDDNGGPYRAIQAVIDATDFDAYLFQDADDWSAADRLAVLLSTAADTGAELVGSHEVRVLVEEGDVVPVRYPLDVSAALADRPTGYPLLHPTSMVTRSLIERLGGYATGMRFSGDAEFLRRAGHVTRIVNADHFGYFRRKRPGSLTHGSNTALGSPARLAVQAELAARAEWNAQRAAGGHAVRLEPWRTAPPATLVHLAGPPPTAATRPRRHQGPPPTNRDAAPVFVIGAARSGHVPLGWALGQHPCFTALPDARWLARIAADIESRAAHEAAPVPSGFRHALAHALHELADAERGRVVAAGSDLLPAVYALARLFPKARYLHVVRGAADTAAALAASPTEGGTFYSTEHAWRHWLSSVEAGLAVEAALGPAVLRVDYDDLAYRGEDTLRRCFDFLGEDVHPACLGPLDAIGGPVGAPTTRPSDLTEAVLAAEERLRVSVEHAIPSETAYRELAERFHRSRRGRVDVGRSLVERVCRLIADAVPDGATVAVVSKGDRRLLDVPGRTCWHIPQVQGGEYAGHHPADGDDAVDQLTALEARGAGYFVVPSAYLWWLTYFADLREYLNREAALVTFHEDVGAVYRLNASAAPHRDNGHIDAAQFVAVPPGAGVRA